MRIREPKTTALIFASGKMVVTGAKSEDGGFFDGYVLCVMLTDASSQDSRLASRKYARIIQKLGFNAKFTDFKIQNIVGSCDIKFPIRLEGLASRHHHFSSYEPELFPGLVSLLRVLTLSFPCPHKRLLWIGPDLSYDQAEDCASHLRQRQDCLDWCESARGNLPGLRDDLPCAEW